VRNGGEPALRIAFDMDGVLADMHAALAIEAERMFDAQEQSTASALEEAIEQEPPAPSPVPRLPGPPSMTLTAQQSEMLWQRVAETDNFWAGLAETEPGIVGRLARLADARRWEVLFVTQRPQTRGATVQKQTQAWLRRHGYDFPSVYTTRGSRGAIAVALNLDVVVDDRFEGCVDVVDESNARSVLVWREPDERVPTRARRLGITVVHSVGECLDLLENADRPRTSEPGLMSRLRHVFRRK
jgi:phosphoglycolate phosphatase-like HAD superfamily hydrolase